MVRFFRCHILQSTRRVSAIILAFALLSGFLIGGYCTGYADSLLLHLMRTAAFSRVSIVHLMPVLLLPFVFSAFAVYIGQRWLIFPIAFIKAFLLAYLTGAIRIFYPGSGVLLGVLLFFADYLIMPVLCWFWFHCFRGRKEFPQICWCMLLLVLAIGYVDSYVVSPFLVSLLS